MATTASSTGNVQQSISKSPITSKLLTPSSGVGTVMLMLLFLAAIETSTNQDVYKLITGKVPLTKQGGTTFIDALSADGAKALGWGIGALVDLVLAAYMPELAVPMTAAIVLGVLLTHEPMIAKYISDVTSSLTPKKAGAK